MKYLMSTAILISLLGTGCLKSPDFSTLSTNFVVVTKTDSLANFSSYHTYYMSDSVATISTVTGDTIIKTANSQKLVDAVKQNMSNRGYTFVPKGSNPDLGINMGVVKITNVGVVYPGWWAGYGGWWDPWYWGGYYPYYYPYAYAYVINTGSVIIDMIDRKNAGTNNSLRVVWGSVMGGAVGDNLDTNVQHGVDAINQAFAQTPQLSNK
ncbi:MAG: DUF4136 domain-containing protein [Flavisolibacter sp.]|jgi:hypothetical protein